MAFNYSRGFTHSVLYCNTQTSKSSWVSALSTCAKEGSKLITKDDFKNINSQQLKDANITDIWTANVIEVGHAVNYIGCYSYERINPFFDPITPDGTPNLVNCQEKCNKQFYRFYGIRQNFADCLCIKKGFNASNEQFNNSCIQNCNDSKLELCADSKSSAIYKITNKTIKGDIENVCTASSHESNEIPISCLSTINYFCKRSENSVHVVDNTVRNGSFREAFSECGEKLKRNNKTEYNTTLFWEPVFFPLLKKVERNYFYIEKPLNITTRICIGRHVYGNFSATKRYNCSDKLEFICKAETSNNVNHGNLELCKFNESATKQSTSMIYGSGSISDTTSHILSAASKDTTEQSSSSTYTTGSFMTVEQSYSSTAIVKQGSTNQSSNAQKTMSTEKTSSHDYTTEIFSTTEPNLSSSVTFNQVSIDQSTNDVQITSRNVQEKHMSTEETVSHTYITNLVATTEQNFTSTTIHNQDSTDYSSNAQETMNTEAANSDDYTTEIFSTSEPNLNLTVTFDQVSIDQTTNDVQTTSNNVHKIIEETSSHTYTNNLVSTREQNYTSSSISNQDSTDYSSDAQETMNTETTSSHDYTTEIFSTSEPNLNLTVTFDQVSIDQTTNDVQTTSNNVHKIIEESSSHTYTNNLVSTREQNYTSSSISNQDSTDYSSDAQETMNTETTSSHDYTTEIFSTQGLNSTSTVTIEKVSMDKTTNDIQTTSGKEDVPISTKLSTLTSPNEILVQTSRSDLSSTEFSSKGQISDKDKYLMLITGTVSGVVVLIIITIVLIILVKKRRKFIGSHKEEEIALNTVHSMSCIEEQKDDPKLNTVPVIAIPTSNQSNDYGNDVYAVVNKDKSTKVTSVKNKGNTDIYAVVNKVNKTTNGKAEHDTGTAINILNSGGYGIYKGNYDNELKPTGKNGNKTVSGFGWQTGNDAIYPLSTGTDYDHLDFKGDKIAAVIPVESDALYDHAISGNIGTDDIYDGVNHDIKQRRTDNTYDHV